ncbi:hypothetical protein ACNOYE_01785 [Nannocystaceae bacterium ST9]
MLVLVLVPACAAEPEPPAFEPPPLRELELVQGYPSPSEPCVGPSEQPSHLLVTSTDFSTGAVGLVEIATREVWPDLALASTDAVPTAWGERAFVINRFGYDWIDELDPRDELGLIHEFPIEPASLEVSANPQALIFDPAGRAWISLYGAPELQVWRVPEAGQVAPEVGFDLSGFADADGVPELGSLIACGSLGFVVAERIDRETWTPADTRLIPIALELEGEALFEFDPEHPGGDAITLLGTGFGAWRLDPADASGHTLLVLNSGLERIDLASGTREWWVDEAVFAELGLTRLHLAGFDLDAQGRAWISAATPDFAEYRLYRIEHSGGAPSLIEVAGDLHSVTGELEIVGDELWFADTTLGRSGLRVFAIDDAAHELEVSPLPVGLPPLALAPLRLESRRP